MAQHLLHYQNIIGVSINIFTVATVKYQGAL